MPDKEELSSEEKTEEKIEEKAPLGEEPLSENLPTKEDPPKEEEAPKEEPKPEVPEDTVPERGLKANEYKYRITFVGPKKSSKTLPASMSVGKYTFPLNIPQHFKKERELPQPYSKLRKMKMLKTEVGSFIVEEVKIVEKITEHSKNNNSIKLMFVGSGSAVTIEGVAFIARKPKEVPQEVALKVLKSCPNYFKIIQGA